MKSLYWGRKDGVKSKCEKQNTRHFLLKRKKEQQGMVIGFIAHNYVIIVRSINHPCCAFVRAVIKGEFARYFNNGTAGIFEAKHNHFDAQHSQTIREAKWLHTELRTPA